MAADISEELLQAADQYMLEPLKRLCEAAIAAGLSTDNLASVYDLSENFNAPQLGRHCMLYALEHYEALVRPAAPLHAMPERACTALLASWGACPCHAAQQGLYLSTHLISYITCLALLLCRTVWAG